MHAVIADICTGCGLCIDPCPVDCIDLHPLPFPQYNRSAARQRFEARNARLLQDKQTKEEDDSKKQGQLVNQKAYIQAALARVIAKKS
jgi:electron transport complex protein RnfB